MTELYTLTWLWLLFTLAEVFLLYYDTLFLFFWHCFHEKIFRLHFGRACKTHGSHEFLLFFSSTQFLLNRKLDGGDDDNVNWVWNRKKVEENTFWRSEVFFNTLWLPFGNWHTVRPTTTLACEGVVVWARDVFWRTIASSST